MQRRFFGAALLLGLLACFLGADALTEKPKYDGPKLVVISFSSLICPPCELQEAVWRKPALQTWLHEQAAVRHKVRLSPRTEPQFASWKVRVTPTTILLTVDEYGKAVKVHRRIEGFLTEPQLLEALEAAVQAHQARR